MVMSCGTTYLKLLLKIKSVGSETNPLLGLTTGSLSNEDT